MRCVYKSFPHLPPLFCPALIISRFLEARPKLISRNFRPPPAAFFFASLSGDLFIYVNQSRRERKRSFFTHSAPHFAGKQTHQPANPMSISGIMSRRVMRSVAFVLQGHRKVTRNGNVDFPLLDSLHSPREL